MTDEKEKPPTVEPRPCQSLGASAGSESVPMIRFEEATHGGEYDFGDGRKLSLLRTPVGWSIISRRKTQEQRLALTHESMDLVVAAVLLRREKTPLPAVKLTELQNNPL